MELKVKVIHPTVEFGNVTVEDIVVNTEKPDEFKKIIKGVLSLVDHAVKETGLQPAQKQSAPAHKSSPPSHKSESGPGGAKEHTGKITSEVNLKYDKKEQPYVSFRFATGGKTVGASIWENAEAIAEALNEGDTVTIYGEITKREKYWNLFAGKLIKPEIGGETEQSGSEPDDIPF